MKITIRDGFIPFSEKKSPDARVIIDVFRASTTLIALCEARASEILIANDLPLVKALSSTGYRVVSEVFDLGIDNSPTLVMQGGFTGQKVILKTTNLTTALAQNAQAKEVLIGCLNNLEALKQYIQSQGYDHLEIIPAGLMEKKIRTAEDTYCAELLKQRLEGIVTPLFNEKLLRKRIEEKLITGDQPGHYIRDLEWAIRLDVSSVVPRVESYKSGIFIVKEVG